jgi:hypothetical protein
MMHCAVNQDRHDVLQAARLSERETPRKRRQPVLKFT